MLSNIIFCIETLKSYHTIQSRCNLIHFGVLHRNIFVTTANLLTFQDEIGILHI